MSVEWKYTITDTGTPWSFEECEMADDDLVTRLTQKDGHVIALETKDEDEARKLVLSDVVAPAFHALLKKCIEKFSPNKDDDMQHLLVKDFDVFRAAFLGDQDAFEAALIEAGFQDKDDIPDVDDSNAPYFDFLYDYGFALTDIHAMLEEESFLLVERTSTD